MLLGPAQHTALLNSCMEGMAENLDRTFDLRSAPCVDTAISAQVLQGTLTLTFRFLQRAHDLTLLLTFEADIDASAGCGVIASRVSASSYQGCKRSGVLTLCFCPRNSLSTELYECGRLL